MKLKSFYLQSSILIGSFSLFVCADTPEWITEKIKKEEIEFVDFMFTDMVADLKTVTIPASQVPAALKNGLSFDGSSIPGCTQIHESDMLLWPDLNTFTRTTDGNARVICDVYASSGVPYEADARHILKTVMQEAQALGYTFLVGPELEFFLFDMQKSNSLIPCDKARYFQAEGLLARDAQNKSLLGALLAQGVNVEKLHHEVAPGQHEISIHYSNALDIADQIIIAKHTIKTFAQAHGLRATFMPKPVIGQNGSGMHVHFSLLDAKNKKNAFYAKDNTLFLSGIAYNFIAGVLHYAPDLSALLNASINSYKRLVPGHEAPIYRCWATKNRSAMIRIPQFDCEQAHAARAEIRSPDALGNPYLIFAGLLKAGLEGIKNNIELPRATEINLYHLSPADLIKRGVTTLPTSLEESIGIFQKSHFIQKLLTPYTIAEYLSLKKEELERYKKQITQWEIEYYL